jgi:hypothetical protein
MQRLIYIFLVFCALFSCTPDDRKAPDVSGISVNVPVERLEDKMMACKTEADVRAFLARHPGFRQSFLGADSAGTDAVAGQVYQLVTNAAIRNLYNETRQAFGDFSGVQAGFTDAFRRIKYYYPDFKVPKIQTAISGLGTLSKGQDLLVSDSLIIISLDFYVGPKASYEPDVPQYVLRRYRKEFIVPSVVLLLSQRYNRTSPTDQSLLTEMVYYGKAFEFARDVQPDLPDSLATVIFSGQQLKETEENREVVWAHFVKEKLLYETSHFKKIKYIGERPYTAEIGAKCPGAIGRWLGWEIVKKYRREHPNVSLPELMSDARTQRIFEESQYKGK